jgi:glycosyltransferase involved in cell wall biosynthesis
VSSVSVVIPCYAYGHFLEEAVASVLEDQPGVDVRVLVIDDASPDDSADVATRIADSDPRVEVVVHGQNKGNIATFNEGLLGWADGDYCMLLSADDRATPGALRRACDLLDANPEVGFAYGRASWFRDGGPAPTARTRVSGWSVTPGQTWLEHRFRQAENPITTPEVIARTSLQQRVGGYDPQLPKAADMELFMRFAAHADVGFIRGADQAFYRLHGTNMSNSVSTLMDLRQRRAVFEAVLERYADRIAGTARLADLVHRQLGREALWAAGRSYDRGRIRSSELGRRLLGGGTTQHDEGVEELVQFAVDCWPDVKRLALHRTLEAHARLGPRDLAFMLEQKGRWWARRRAWRYRGY